MGSQTPVENAIVAAHFVDTYFEIVFDISKGVIGPALGLPPRTVGRFMCGRVGANRV
jgi:hypothetical protein